MNQHIHIRCGLIHIYRKAQSFDKRKHENYGKRKDLKIKETHFNWLNQHIYQIYKIFINCSIDFLSVFMHIYVYTWRNLIENIDA